MHKRGVARNLSKERRVSFVDDCTYFFDLNSIPEGCWSPAHQFSRPNGIGDAMGLNLGFLDLMVSNTFRGDRTTRRVPFQVFRHCEHL